MPLEPSRRRLPTCLRRVALDLALCALLLGGAGCRQEMWEQPKYEPLDASPFFSNNMASRPLIEGTVAEGEFHTNESFFTGLAGTNPVTQFPFPITQAVLERGRERFNIYCAPCHDTNGTGNGIIVQRGFPHPPDFHSQDQRQDPVGHYFRVITYGHGKMYPYATRVAPEDRWKIAAHIRVLQGELKPDQMPPGSAEKRNEQPP